MLHCSHLSVEIWNGSNMCRSLLYVMSDSKNDISNKFCIWKRFFLKKIGNLPEFQEFCSVLEKFWHNWRKTEHIDYHLGLEEKKKGKTLTCTIFLAHWGSQKQSTTFSKCKKWKEFFFGRENQFFPPKNFLNVQNQEENQKKCEKSRFSAIFHTFFDFLLDFSRFWGVFWFFRLFWAQWSVKRHDRIQQAFVVGM